MMRLRLMVGVLSNCQNHRQPRMRKPNVVWVRAWPSVVWPVCVWGSHLSVFYLRRWWRGRPSLCFRGPAGTSHPECPPGSECCGRPPPCALCPWCFVHLMQDGGSRVTGWPSLSSATIQCSVTSISWGTAVLWSPSAMPRVQGLTRKGFVRKQLHRQRWDRHCGPRSVVCFAHCCLPAPKIMPCYSNDPTNSWNTEWEDAAREWRESWSRPRYLMGACH